MFDPALVTRRIWRSKRSAHLRCNFYELATLGPSPIESEALEHTAAPYAVEKEIPGRSADERRTVRKQKSRPLVDALNRSCGQNLI
jgi:hypothetical protein